MVQSMLADRFKLKVSRETRELPVYALVVAKHGPKLTESKLPPPRNHGFHGLRFMGWGDLSRQAASMSLLANVLTQHLERLVVDETGLKGRYDFTLK